MERLALLFTLLTASATLLSGENDEAYYQAHLDEAKAKYEACQNLVAELAGAGKIEEMMQVAEDPECKAAEAVFLLNQDAN